MVSGRSTARFTTAAQLYAGAHNTLLTPLPDLCSYP